MNCKLTKSELIYQMMELINQTEDLTRDEKYWIIEFLERFVEKSLPEDNKLQNKIHRILLQRDAEEFKEAYPDLYKRARKELDLEIAQKMKEDGQNLSLISRVTELSLEEVEKL